MDAHRFDLLTRAWIATGSRRAVFGVLAAVAGLLRNAEAAIGKKKRSKKGKRSKILCRSDGRLCKKESERCKRKFCLKTPFTIEAQWLSPSQDHDAFLFVPNEPGNNEPFPFIAYSCLAGDTNNGALYPFAFMSGDAQGPGDEVATVQRLLEGKYEYWTRVHGPAASGDLTVRLRNANGKVIDTWTSPPNPSSTNEQVGWHVFDINGATHSIKVVDEAGIDPFDDVHPENTDVCPV